MRFSVIIPVYNERDSMASLYLDVTRALRGLSYEVLVMDDGSTDGTAESARNVSERAWRVLSQEHRGKDWAVYCGIQQARSSLIVLVDGDLQQDPRDIRLLLERYHQTGAPCVVGWRTQRADGLVKKISSFIGNSINNGMFGLHIHDANCPLKLFEKQFFTRVRFFPHFHRFLCALIAMQGGRVIEVPVKHFPRQYGTSHYGIRNRIVGNLVSLMRVRFRTHTLLVR